MKIKNFKPYLSIIGVFTLIGWLNFFPTSVAGQGETGTSKVSSSDTQMPTLNHNGPMAMKLTSYGENQARSSQSSCDDYLVNGDFEENSTWVFDGNAGYDSENAESGYRSGYISTYDNVYGEDSDMRQTIEIPDSYESIAITFDTLLFSMDEGDNVYIRIFDESMENELYNLTLFYSYLDQWSTWGLEPLTWLGGQTINLVFSVTHDNYGGTNYYYTGARFDNISVKICTSSYATATPTPYYYPPTATNTPYPTATPTPYPTATPTNTNTPYPTSTNTSTATNTYYPTATPTNTPYPTSTSTNTSTATNTYYPTSTPTPTSTSTNTSTATNTYYPTATPTNTNTPYPTSTNTSTATNTYYPTATPADTMVPRETPAPTATASDTPFPTATFTDTPSTTPSTTPFNTPSLTPTPSNTPLLTATPTMSSTNTPTYTPTSTPIITPTNTPPSDSSNLNLRVRTLEVSQSIQNPSATVPLIANRHAIGRVFIDVENDSPVQGVTAHLHAARNGEELSGSPILPFNSGRAIDASQTPDRRNFNDSLNFHLPTHWTQAGETTFWVEVNPERSVIEENYNDNRSQNFVMNFQEIPPLEVVLIPIVYQKNGSGPEFRPEMNAENNFGLGMLQKIYPVSNLNHTRHPEYAFRGDLSTSDGWHTLLKEIVNLRAREQNDEAGNPASMPKYYGVLHAEAEHYLGLAYRPGTSGIGLVDVEIAAAHEIGHNLGLRHVSCGGATGLDTGYPYPEGSIGHVGIDITQNILVLDTEHHDMMSYCAPRWISDYNYRKIFDMMATTRIQSLGISQEAGEGWLISGRINPDLTGQLETAEPITSSAVVQGTGSGAYQLEMIDQDFNVQFRYNFDPMEIAQESREETPADFSFIVPRIDNLKHIQIRRGGEIVDEMAAATVAPVLTLGPDALVVDENIDEVNLIWGTGVRARSAITSEVTVNVRYSPDDGESWHILATGLSDNKVDLSRSELPASANGLIELVAVDRNQTTTKRIPIGEVSDKSPSVGIIRNDDNEYHVGEPIVLEGTVMDMEDSTIPDSRLVWSVDGRPSERGTTFLLIEELTPGEHIIEFAATDSADNVTRDAIKIMITSDDTTPDPDELKIFLPFISR